ncbi:hypothetical protein J6590_075851 [Homalodisca vitripennis]|nr:hypothetical protein J6590_088398 [Homalodisca vitripennis]KAG8325101.1 hypothetical protein J6590_075851 [Homalodisca vitripennis]
MLNNNIVTTFRIVTDPESLSREIGGREKVVRMVKPKAQIESRDSIRTLNIITAQAPSRGKTKRCSDFSSAGRKVRLDCSSGESQRGARISLAQDERFRLDCPSGRGDRGARISLAQDERFRLGCSSGERQRGVRISLAQDERYRLGCSSGKRQRGARISLAQDERFRLDCSSRER